MKVIFLDIDGVLCTPLSFRLNRLLRLPAERQRFDPVSLYWLRRVVRATGAEVVLSSSWRDGLLMMDDPFFRAAMRNLFRRLQRNGTPLTEVTPMLLRGGKGADIAAWLGCNPCEYVVLDDNDCFSEHPEVAARWIPIPDSKGLRRKEALAAIKRLRE